MEKKVILWLPFTFCTITLLINKNKFVNEYLNLKLNDYIR